MDVPEGKGAGGATYWRQLAITVAVLALYWLGGKVPMPFVDRGVVEHQGVAMVTVIALGVRPLVAGFVFVELFSLLIPAGRRLRRDGLEGRATLNRAALVTSLVAAGIQAVGILIVLESLTSAGDGPAFTSPAWVYRTTIVVTLVGATALLFATGRFLTEHGIGNGFALLMLADLAMPALRRWSQGASDSAPTDVASPLSPAALILGLGLLLYFAWVERDRLVALLPAFPQGVLPVTWTLLVLGLPDLFGPSFELPALQFVPLPLMSIVALLFLVPAFSWGTFHLFSSPSRLKDELAESPGELDGLALSLRRRLVPSTIVLACGAVAMSAWNDLSASTGSREIGFVPVLFVVAIGLDLRDQWRFVAKHGRPARLLELDNVHLATLLADRLDARGLQVHLQARRCRGLLFFFGPLVKIGVLVPLDQVDRAVAELESCNVEVV